MEPALPLPLRLELAHAPVSMDHTAVSESISAFLAQYAARTGTHNAAEDAAGSTGGVVAAQLTRLMNGLAGKIDYDAFATLIAGNAETVDELDTPMEVLEPSAQQETHTQDEADQVKMLEQEEKDKKDKKDKKEKKDKKKKDKVKTESS